jgi:hypothetical protein
MSRKWKSEGRVGCLRGGTIINVIFIAVVLSLLGFAIWWIIKSFGQAGEQYTQALIKTQDKAEALACQMNLRTIGQNLQMYAIDNERLPASMESLKSWSGDSRLYRCPSKGGPEYIYIPGQHRDMPATNVVVYEPAAMHDGRCSVLRLGGEIELLTPEELKAAVELTLAGLR